MIIITDTPAEGYYRMRLVRGGPLVGIKIWYGPPLDPSTLDVMDRGFCWNALANGDWIDVDRVWPACANEMIDEAEYRYLAALTQHAKQTDGANPMANVRRATDWSTATPPRP